MRMCTVRLDKETEQVLREIQRLTGLSVSAALKRGILSVRKELATRARARPYDLYAQLDLGPGGYARASSTRTRKGAQAAIRRKLGR